VTVELAISGSPSHFQGLCATPVALRKTGDGAAVVGHSARNVFDGSILSSW
jgi:hypothetical protein